jgi:hypothetical protein
MERLTYRLDESVVPTKLDVEFVLDISNEAWNGLKAIFNRLADYEDLDITPAELADKLARLEKYERAEKGRRCVVLPVWGRVFIHSDGKVQEMEMCHYRGNATGVYDMRCECIDQHEDCDRICGNKNGEACAYNFRIAELGKTVFLTRAEAEAALNRKEGDDAPR